MAAAPQTPSVSLYSAQGAFAFAAAVTAWRLFTLATNHLNLSFDEAQYWIWARQLEFGYFSKPPLIAWVIALTTQVCGEGETCVKLGSPLAYMGSSLALFALGRELYGPRVGFWSAVVFVTLPAVSLSSMIISVDPFLILFWALGLVALIRAIATESLRWWLLLGVMIGLGLLTKYAMAFFVLSLITYLVWSPERRGLLRRPGPWLAVGVGLAMLAPNVLWNMDNHFVTFVHTKANANISGLKFHPGKAAEFIGSQFLVFGPLLFGTLLAIIAAARRMAAADEGVRLLLAFILPTAVIMTAESFLSRANANWAAPIYVGATVLVIGWAFGDEARRGRARLVHASLALHLIAAVALYNGEALARVAGFGLSEKTDLAKRVRGWDKVGQSVARVWATHPDTRLLFDHRRVMTTLTYYIHPHPFNAAKWNESGRVSNHFDLTADLALDPRGSFLLVTEEPNADHVAPWFTRSELLSVIRVPLYPGYAREVRVFRVEGFKGYGR
ncbi:MAG: glycosyltransferase family 39 protein [Alphaproteobacteria bacterium]|nr:glycosyltransferase family 39 protein [Alphaproteobacteria bacterium]MBF0128738.1 glycosyltransferase family 39 protein [Alphaproteobacteria bacterium]